MTGLDEFATLWAHWMFHAGWQVAVLVIVAFAILKLGRQRISSQLKYAILLIVLVKFATPPFLHFSTGLFSQPVVAQFSESTFVAYGEEQVNTVDLPVIDQPSSKTNMEADKDQRRSDLPIASTPADISQTKISGDAFSTNGFSWLSVGICVYLAGVLFFGLRLVFGWVNVRMAVSRSELQLSGDLVDEFSDLAGRLNLRNVPQLKLSGVVDSPFATGVFNPVVVLTKDVVHSLSPDQRRIVMAHELVHIRRRDQVVGVAEAVLGVVWWFHPAMWWLTRSLRQTREDCCDDVLVASGIAQAERYCETLIDTAASRPFGLLEPLALGFANHEHPAGRRIRRLMDDSVFRSDRIRFSALCLAVLIALVSLPGMKYAPTPTVEPATPVTKVQEEPDPAEENQVGTPSKFTGTIVDTAGKPIEGANVRVRVLSYSANWKTTVELAEKELVTDVTGAFEVDVKKEADGDHQIEVSLTADAQGYCARHQRTGKVDRNAKQVELPPLAIAKGIRIKGRLTGPADLVGDAPIDPAVILQTSYQLGHLRPQFHLVLNCDENGHFEAVVPADGELNLFASAANFASSKTKHTIEPTPEGAGEQQETVDLGDIRLKRGVSVFGVAKLIDGTPAAGVVIALMEGTMDNRTELISAKTDRQGKFRFPPVSGKCTLVAFETCVRRKVVNNESLYFKSDGKVPLFDSMSINLDGKGAEHEIEMKEAETVLLSGAVRYNDGSPLPNHYVFCGWQTEFGELVVDYVRTDKNGKFSFKAPKGRKPSIRVNHSFIGQDGYTAYLDVSSEFNKEIFANPAERRTDKLKFKAVMEDVADLDWVMVKRQRGGRGIVKRVGQFAKWWFLGGDGD